MRLRASKPFVASGSEFLWFCLAVRSSGIAGSRRLGIANEWLAQDLDNAVAYRLLRFDNEIRENQMKTAAILNANEMSKVIAVALGGSVDDDDEPAEVW